MRPHRTRAPARSAAVRRPTFAALLLAGLMGGAAWASHGVLVGGVVVEFLGLRPLPQASSPEGCVVDGAIHNGSDRQVTVRIAYRGYDAAGVPLRAYARLPGVAPGERRQFASSPFVTTTQGTYACSALRRVEMIEAAADPAP